MVISEWWKILPTTSLIFHKMKNNPQLYESSDPDNSIYDKLNTYSKSNYCLLEHTV